jgi:hypothetical protein
MRHQPRLQHRTAGREQYRQLVPVELGQVEQEPLVRVLAVPGAVEQEPLVRVLAVPGTVVQQAEGVPAELQPVVVRLLLDCFRNQGKR